MAPYKTTPEGVAAIAGEEGLRLRAYKDTGGVLTIGYGHTSAAGPPEVTPGLRITKERALEIFAQDIAPVERDVRKLVKVAITQGMFDALVSFAFNVGQDIDLDDKPEGLGDSTLLAKLNAGDYRGAANEFRKWNKVDGRIVGGLTTRRAREKAMFLRDGIPTTPKRVPLQRDEVPAGAEAELDESMIERLQTELRRVGYVEVGKVDGLFGRETLMAMQRFQRDFKLPVTEHPTRETLARLMVTADGMRPIDEARREATAKDVARDVPEVMKPTQRAKKAAERTTFWSLVGGLFTSVGLSAGGEWVDRVFGLPPMVLGMLLSTLLLLAVGGGGFMLLTGRIEKGLVGAYAKKLIN